MKTRTALLLCVLACSLPAVCMAGSPTESAANSPDGLSVEVVDFGIYNLQLGETIETPDTGTGSWTKVSKETLLQETRTIPARIGMGFGYRYRVRGLDKGEAITLLFVLKRPPMVHPDTGDISREDRHEEPYKIDELDFDGFEFEFDWELVPGKYVFEIYHQGSKLSEQPFTVIEE